MSEFKDKPWDVGHESLGIDQIGSHDRYLGSPETVGRVLTMFASAIHAMAVQVGQGQITDQDADAAARKIERQYVDIFTGKDAGYQIIPGWNDGRTLYWRINHLVGDDKIRALYEGENPAKLFGDPFLALFRVLTGQILNAHANVHQRGEDPDEQGERIQTLLKQSAEALMPYPGWSK